MRIILTLLFCISCANAKVGYEETKLTRILYPNTIIYETQGKTTKLYEHIPIPATNVTNEDSQTEINHNKEEQENVTSNNTNVLTRNNNVIFDDNIEKNNFVKETIVHAENDPKAEDNGTALILTPLILRGLAATARTASLVDPAIFLGIKSYSGFLTVNTTYNSNLFFWYFPVIGKPVSTTPWIVWLQGGPGASSLTGLFDEIGPFTVDVNGTLKLTNNTWSFDHSLLFIDNPVGTGYSFTDSPQGFVKDMPTFGGHLYFALQQFLQMFPELRVAPLFLGGESYAGKYVPALAMQIHNHRISENMYPINLKGMLLGNAFIEPTSVVNLTRVYYHFGLINEQQQRVVQPLQDAFLAELQKNNSSAAKDKWFRLIVILQLLSHQQHGYNFLRDSTAVGKYVRLLQRSDIKRAIHVGDIGFSFINVTVHHHMAEDFLSNAGPLVEELLNHYRVLVYCGQLDQMVPCMLSSEAYHKWSWTRSWEFANSTRYPFLYEGKLAGYYQSGGGLTEAVLRGAGHMVPAEKPLVARELVSRFVLGRQLSAELPIFDLRYIQEYIRNYSSLLP